MSTTLPDRKIPLTGKLSLSMSGQKGNNKMLNVDLELFMAFYC